MKALSLKNIDRLCQQLIASGANNTTTVDKILREGIQQRIVDKDSFPLIIQRLTTTHKSWMVALSALESPQLDRHRIPRDPNLWRTIDAGLPPNDPVCKEAVEKRLKAVFGKGQPTKAKVKRSVD